jgi:hypothetical protein
LVYKNFYKFYYNFAIARLYARNFYRAKPISKVGSFEIGFAFAPVSLKPYANAAIKGCSFKNHPTFERASAMVE